MSDLKSLSIATILAGMLVGCGGGSGSSSSSSTATLIDDFVSGVKVVYSNGSPEAYTDSNGNFPYTDGSVEFFVGDVKLGTVNAVPVDGKVFLQDIIGVPRTNISNPDVIKLGRFLQSLDSDPSTDAIEIDQTNFDLFEAPNDTETDLLDNGTDVDALLVNAGFNAQNIVSATEAQSHIENILEAQGEITTSTILSLSSSTINNGDTNVDIDADFELTFNDQIPRRYLTGNYFILTNDSTNTSVSATITRDQNIVTITPLADLDNSENYTLTIKNTIKSYAGVDISLGGNTDEVISFTTENATASSNQDAVWVLANGTSASAVENTASSYVIDLSGSTDADSDTLSYEWFLSPTGSPVTIYNQSSGNISANTLTTINFTTADQRTNTPTALPAGTYDLRIVKYEDRGTGTPVSTSQTVTITINAASTGGNTSGNNPDAFIIKIDTDLDTVNTNKSFYIDNRGTADALNIDCDNDGTYEFIASTPQANYTCNYSTSGVYEIAITSTDPEVYFNFTTNTAGDINTTQITEIVNWGNIKWENMSAMFRNATNLTTINSNAGNPDLSNVSSMYLMFADATSFNADISGWDVSNVSDFISMFSGATIFNQDISGWNVSNALSLAGMFNNARAFNQDISGWNVSNVTSTSSMFNNARAFNQDISGWNVSSVTNMLSMFESARAFNQDISSWNISNVEFMNRMFRGAFSFDQDLSTWYPLKNVNLNTTDIFQSSGMSQANQDSFLVGPVVAPLNAVITAQGISGTPFCSPSRRVGSEFITFTGNSSTGNIVSYTWTDVTAGNSNNFIDGGTTVSETYSCVGLPGGQRTIRLTVEDSSGNTDTQDQTLNVVY